MVVIFRELPERSLLTTCMSTLISPQTSNLSTKHKHHFLCQTDPAFSSRIISADESWISGFIFKRELLESQRFIQEENACCFLNFQGLLCFEFIPNVRLSMRSSTLMSWSVWGRMLSKTTQTLVLASLCVQTPKTQNPGIFGTSKQSSIITCPTCLNWLLVMSSIFLKTEVKCNSQYFDTLKEI